MTFEKGTAVLEKYRAKYPELASYIREIVPGERRIEIRQRLEGEDINLHLFAIRVLEDEVRYEVKLSGDAEHKTVKPPEWLSLLHDKLARIVAKILYARETSKPEKQDLDLSGPRRDPREPQTLSLRAGLVRRDAGKRDISRSRLHSGQVIPRVFRPGSPGC